MSLDGQGDDASRRADLSRLLDLMDSEFGRDEGVDWRCLEEAWGLRFPSDYKSFMTICGAGVIDDSISVLLPDSPDSVDAPGRMGAETDNICEIWRRSPGRPLAEGVTPRTGRPPLLVWGGSVAADVVCWLAEGDDPDQWPVIVWKRQSGTNWAEYGCGMVEFLRALLAGEFQEWPLSVRLSESGPHKFINWREEQRLLDAGIDPWTGEPDPYAGLSFDD